MRDVIDERVRPHVAGGVRQKAVGEGQQVIHPEQTGKWLRIASSGARGFLSKSELSGPALERLLG